MSESAVGQSIGPYQVVEVIDDTGDALVLKSFQSSANRYVALKVLKPHSARNATAVQQFKQQGELTAKMEHPNILPVYDMGQDGGVVYQVSRYVAGGSLRAHMGAYRDVRQAQGLFHGIAAGLEYIHNQGYTHGNLRPSHILLDEGPRPLLTAPVFASQPGATPTPYMSPEQVQGGAVDRRTDVYAMGVVLYETLVGSTPAPGAPVSLRASRPDLSESLEQVVLKALAQNPDSRFQTVTEFQSALDGALRPVAPQPVPAQAPAPTPAPAAAPQPAPQKGTNWPAIILGGLLIVALIAIGVFVAREVSDQPADEAPPAAEAPAATEAPPQVEVILPTREPRPTREPNDPPAEEAPPAEQAPGEDAPPTEDSGSSGLPICGSIGFAGALVVGGGAMASRKRRD